MIRKFRILGTAFIAVLALSAVGASAASAEGVYRVSSTPAVGTGTSELGNDTFTTEAGTVECKSAFDATQNVPSASSLTVTPTYSNCKAFGFAATVDKMSCDYLFTTPVTNGGAHSWKANVDVKCATPGDHITVIAGPCTAGIPEQGPLTHVGITSKTNAGADDVTVQATVHSITYTVIKDGFLCPFNGTGTRHDGKYHQIKPVTFHVPGIDITVGHP